MEQPEHRQLGQYIPLHYHYQMLSNQPRMTAFRQAIEYAVRPGMAVADLGSGTGVLSFLAARRSARVYAVEAIEELVETSRALLAANGVAGRATVSQGDAAAWLPPEPVDVVICEMLHSALLREKQLDVLNAFRAAHLAAFGRVPRFLPEATLLAVQPVLQHYEFEGYHAPVPLFQDPYAQTPDCRPAEQPLLYATVDYAAGPDAALAARLSWQFAEAAEVNALRFITKSVLAADIEQGRAIDWFNHYLVMPLAHPLALAPGQWLRARFGYRAGDGLAALGAALTVEIA